MALLDPTRKTNPYWHRKKWPCWLHQDVVGEVWTHMKMLQKEWRQNFPPVPVSSHLVARYSRPLSLVVEQHEPGWNPRTSLAGTVSGHSISYIIYKWYPPNNIISVEQDPLHPAQLLSSTHAGRNKFSASETAGDHALCKWWGKPTQSFELHDFGASMR